MLHILNGDCAAGVLRQTDLPGEHCVWRESLMTGPAPADLSQKEWIETRAIHLATAYRPDAETCRNDLARQFAELEKFTDHSEVVLWFEYDLFCQLNLIYLLDWFSRRARGNTKLWLVCMEPRADGAKGLGELEPAEMAALYAGRVEITNEALGTALRAWAAYTSSDPRRLVDLLGDDLSALPFLKDAIVCHLRRFPFIENGLSYLERAVLEMTYGESKSFADLFREFGEKAPLYGMGDSQFWHEMRGLFEAGLITKTPAAEASIRSSYDVTIAITEAGHAAFRNDAKLAAYSQIDRWLGGVHLSGSNLWLWDDRVRKLVRHDARTSPS
jgi:hypothetical protein